MLLGRVPERLALERTIAEAHLGRGGVLGLVGEPGIGKTALLDHAARAAAGFRVLRVRGVQTEAELPFGGLAELLRPCLTALGQIPEPQAAALSGALALAPAQAGDRFAIGAAALSLLSASAEEQPLLMLVDDAHWLDDPSAQALLFVARRLFADPIALVAAVREGEASFLDGADLRVLPLAGLGRSDAATLVAESGLSDELVDRLHRTTGGNPLAMLELASDVSRLEARTPSEPVPMSTSIADAFLHRFGRLPDATRRLLVLTAASDDGDLAVLDRAAPQLGLKMSDYVDAEDAGMVSIDRGQVEFHHPLARAAMYAQASAGERRAAHAALARAVPEQDEDRRAWHLAAAALGPDDQAAEALAAAAARARERSAYAVAAAAYERCATLTSDTGARGELLLSAADAAWLAGDAVRAVADLEEGRRIAGDPVRLARMDYLRGIIAMRRGPSAEGYPLMIDAAGRIADDDPELAIVMLAQSVHGAFYAGDTPAMLSAAQRAHSLTTRASSRRSMFLADMARGMALVADGQGEAGAQAVRAAVAILEDLDELRAEPALLVWASMGPLWLREIVAGRDIIDRAFDRARDLVAVGVLPSLLHMFARDEATTEHWAEAAAHYDEALRLARETGQRVELAAALAGAACLEARQGRDVECRLHAAEAASLCDELGIGFYRIWAIQAVGDLELGLGNAAESIRHHEAQATELRRSGIADVDLSPAPELVDAHLRLGNTAQAHQIATDYRERAQAKGQPWAIARAARCGGLLSSYEDMEAWFDEALRLHERTPDVFEAARTQLAFGARLRRSRQRVRAREQLRAALSIFERLGSTPWAHQAEAELAATGETARRRDVSALSQLTPQELQIARLLATGRTTRETAAAVFVSPKTVEYHLRHVYDKLGIRSREELVRALRTTP